MSRLVQTGVGGKYASLVSMLSTLATNLGGNYNKESARQIASLESAGANELQSAKTAYKQFDSQFKSFVTADNELAAYQNVSNEGMEAASIILAACQDPGAYRSASKAAMANAGEHRVFGHGQSLGLEAFDSGRSLDAKVELSVAYQLLAARQDEFAEQLYHTLVLTPDQAMYRATIERTFVTTGAKHKIDGNSIELKKTNVLEAYRNADVLRNDSTKLIPNVTDDNEGFFVLDTEIGHTTKLVDGYEVVTAPISITANDYSLVALTTHQGLIEGGMFNQNDAIDPSIRIDTVYLKVTDGTTVEFIPVRVKNSPTSQFLKTTEGNGQLTRLTMRNNGVRVKATTRTTTGAVSTLLNGLAALDGTLTLEVVMNADLFLDRATVKHVSAQPVAKLSVTTEDGQSLSPGSTPAVQNLTFTVHGYDVDGRRTNSALRTRGLLADSDIYQEVMTVGLLPPFTVQRPRNEQGTKDVDTLVTLTHIAITNGAVTKLLEYNEVVRDYFVNNPMNTSTADWAEANDLEGIARMVLTPYHDVISINLPEVLNSLTSTDKLSDVRNHFVNVMTEAGYRMVQRTGYRPAMEMMSGAANRKVQITAATDVVLPQYMMIEGDDRTTGPVLDLKIVSSPDIRMLGKIFMVFTTDSREFDPLHFGNLLWIPELVSKTDVTREGQNLTETTIHPRWRHINNVPAMIEINVLGLTEVMQKRTVLAVNNTLMNPEDLPRP